MMWRMALLFTRTVEQAPASGGFGESPFNIIFIVAFALGISYLALRIARRGGKK